VLKEEHTVFDREEVADIEVKELETGWSNGDKVLLCLQQP